jgi:tape measure domain-containing protein
MARVARLGVVIDSSGAKKGAQETNTALNSIDQTAKRAVESLKKAAATLGVAFAIKGIQQAVDQYTLLDARLRQVTGSGAAFARVQQELFTIAQSSRASYAATIDLYTRLARSSDQLGISQTQLVSVTEAVSNAVRLSNASTGAAEAGLMQLGQAFASGTLRGDELRSIMEQLPAVAKAIADGLGVPIGRLREMGEAGELSGRKVALALDQQREKLALLAGEIPTTIGQALTQLNNAFGMVVAGSDEAKSATAGIAGALGEAARFMVEYKDAVVAVSVALGAGGLALAAAKAGTALAATSGGAVITALLSQVTAVTSLSAAYAFLQLAAGAAWTAITGPIGLAIAGMTAVAAAVYFWRTRQKETTEAVKETTKSAADLYAAAKKLAEVNWAPPEMLTQLQNLGFELRAAQTGGKQVVDVYREASKAWKDTSDKARTFGQALAEGDAKAKTLLATTTAQVQLSAQVESTLDRQTKAQQAAAKATEDRATIEREYQGQWVQLGIELAERAAAAERQHAEAIRESAKILGEMLTKRAVSNAQLQAQVSALLTSRRAYDDLTDSQERLAAMNAALAEAQQKGVLVGPAMLLMIGSQVAETQRLLKLKQALLELDGKSPFSIPTEETKEWGASLATVANTARDIAQVFGNVGTEITKAVQLASQLAASISAANRAAAAANAAKGKPGEAAAKAASGAASLGVVAGIASVAVAFVSVANTMMKAQREDAAAKNAANRAFAQSVSDFAESLAASGMSDPQRQIASGQAGIQALVDAALKATGARYSGIVPGMPASADNLSSLKSSIDFTIASGTAGKAAGALREFSDALAAIIVQAKASEAAIAAQQAARLAAATEDLEVRRLTALGMTDEAAARKLALDQQREIAAAEKEFGKDSPYLASLRDVQAAERAAAEAARARVEAQKAADRVAFGLDLTQRRQTLNGDSRGAFITGQTIANNSALAQAQQLVEAGVITAAMFEELKTLLGDEFAQALRDFDEAARQAKQAVQDDLAVRALVAQGRGTEAEQARIEIANRKELEGVTDEGLRAQILYVQGLEAVARATEAAAEAERIRAEQNASIDQRMIDALRILDPERAKELEARQTEIDRAREIANAADDATRARLRELYAMQDAAKAAIALAEAMDAQRKKAEELADFTRSIGSQYLRATGKSFDADVADLNDWRTTQLKQAASVGAGADVIAQINAIYDARYSKLIADQMQADAPAPVTAPASLGGSTAVDPSITLGEDTIATRSARSITEATALQLVDYAASQTALLRRLVQLAEGGSGPTGESLRAPSLDLVDRQLGARANTASLLLAGSVR